MKTTDTKLFPLNPEHGDIYIDINTSIEYVWDSYDNQWAVYDTEWMLYEMVRQNQLLGFYD